METALIQALLGSGPIGLACYILLQQRNQDRQEREAERTARAELDRDRLATDKKIAAALMALALKITGKPSDGDPV